MSEPVYFSEGFPAEPFSRLKETHFLFQDTRTGQRGTLLEAYDIHWRSKSSVDIQADWLFANSAGGGARFRLSRKAASWRVDGQTER